MLFRCNSEVDNWMCTFSTPQKNENDSHAIRDVCNNYNRVRIILAYIDRPFEPGFSNLHTASSHVYSPLISLVPHARVQVSESSERAVTAGGKK